MRPAPATKLRPPRSARTAVARPRLDALLDDARQARRATLLIAPAGYGKTTLAAGWVASRAPRAAWFSVDPGDAPDDLDERGADELVATWLSAALSEAGALDGPAVRDGGGSVPAPSGVAAVAAALDASPWRGVFVLDDAHHVGTAAGQALATWVERAPDGVHTLLLARHTPPLPVARWLARGDAEVMGLDVLRLTPEEGRSLATDLLPDLTHDLADALVERVEGWPAGLHLAARSLRGRVDPADLIDRFTGTDRYVLAFLTEEVLLRLPDDLHEAVLLLAAEPRLCAGLVAALTGRSDAVALLARLEAHEAFLERLDVFDADAPWFRFPGFFRDLLAHRLALARPDLPPALRSRAERWWGARGTSPAPTAGAIGIGAVSPPQGAASDVPRSDEALTPREREVLALVARGASTKEIARALDLSPNTVKTHTRHLFEKLGVGSRAAAAARARELGLA
jgi:LuxR family transcriptional regulator, maltose regulon positive regulatory protein